MQLIISKSTTADLLKMHHKLDEFFSQQFKSSRRVFSSLQPTRHKSSVKHRPKDGNRKLANGKDKLIKGAMRKGILYISMKSGSFLKT